MALVIGLVVTAFSAPSIMSAISDGRAPRSAMVALVAGGGLVLFALTQKPGSYRIEEIPQTFIKVIADVF
ncbi:MAG: hypothetical protein LPK02_13930 [Rhodobacterales bacterium]|nr:hypothetical protein [Rhodobacterales bacterium]MDX5414133.1 hypothetical protein [Rhodobacterales bacterium]